MSTAIVIQQIDTTITIQQKDATIHISLDIPADHAFFGGPNFDDARNMVWM